MHELKNKESEIIKSDERDESDEKIKYKTLGFYIHGEYISQSEYKHLNE